ncbi:MAG: flagellar basal body-associated FliL family protein [Clostridiaceae bacterium]
MESKGNFFILIIVIAVLALTLAALAGYLFIVQGHSDDSSATVTGKVEKDIPSKDERVKIALYDGKRVYNLKNIEEDKASLIQVAVTLECYKTLQEDKKAIVEDKVNAYIEEIQELVVRFFLTKTSEDVKDVAFMDNAKEELTKQINALLNEGVKKPEDIVYKVIFSEWLFQ